MILGLQRITNSLRRFEDAVFSIGTKTHLSNVGKPDAAQKRKKKQMHYGVKF